ncbi:MAG TPA: purine phosphoribosyltransferase family protein [Solirubrobacterales bacterium]|nr:purine phosphoribosyltransferase family protein [Solirubrobacterales bacterium]
MFKDITPLLLDPDASGAALAWLVERARRHEVDLVVGIEARGLIFGGALAHELGVGFAPARKEGKLPAERVSVEYELEYGVDALELHADAIGDGTRVLLHDDRSPPAAPRRRRSRRSSAWADASSRACSSSSSRSSAAARGSRATRSTL